jgi:hypothetical protein
MTGALNWIGRRAMRAAADTPGKWNVPTPARMIVEAPKECGTLEATHAADIQRSGSVLHSLFGSMREPAT